CSQAAPGVSCGLCLHDALRIYSCSVATPGNFGQSCDAGCGTIQCNGQCSTAGHGGSCGSCGGTVQCNGSCSVQTPGNLGQACDGGGSTNQWNAVCSTARRPTSP